jgi:hypothetical protein
VHSHHTRRWSKVTQRAPRHEIANDRWRRPRSAPESEFWNEKEWNSCKHKEKHEQRDIEFKTLFYIQFKTLFSHVSMQIELILRLENIWSACAPLQISTPQIPQSQHHKTYANCNSKKM